MAPALHGGCCAVVCRGQGLRERAADPTQRRRAPSPRPRAGLGAPAGAPAAAAAGAPEGVGLAYNAPPWWDAPPGWGAAGACGAPPRPLAALASASVTNNAAPTVTLRFPAPYAADACAPGCLLAAVGPGALVPGTWAAAAGDAYTFTLQARAARGCGPALGRAQAPAHASPPSCMPGQRSHARVRGGSLARRQGAADLRGGLRDSPTNACVRATIGLTLPLNWRGAAAVQRAAGAGGPVRGPRLRRGGHAVAARGHPRAHLAVPGHAHAGRRPAQPGRQRRRAGPGRRAAAAGAACRSRAPAA